MITEKRLHLTFVWHTCVIQGFALKIVLIYLFNVKAQ